MKDQFVYIRRDLDVIRHIIIQYILYNNESPENIFRKMFFFFFDNCRHNSRLKILSGKQRRRRVAEIIFGYVLRSTIKNNGP